MQISDLETATDLCWGLAFLGTGGGGRVEAGLDMLRPVLASGRRPVIAKPGELPDDTLTCWAIIVGGKDPDEPPPASELESSGLKTEVFPQIVPRLVQAVRELGDYAGVKVGALVSMELSSAATIATMLTALELGIPTLDSDYVGRAIPELSLTKLELLGLSPMPVVMVDRWGNTTIIKKATGAAMMDRLGRMISRAAYGRGIASVGHLLKISEIREALVPGTLLKAIEFGAVLRRGDLAQLRSVTGGRVVFEGKTAAVEWRNNEPYTHRELDYVIEGTGSCAASTLRIWIKNEHHVAWRDKAVVATSPDIIAVLDPSTCKPLTTLGDVQPGTQVVVFAMRCFDDAWRSPAGKALLGPGHFGFDFGPVEL